MKDEVFRMRCSVGEKRAIESAAKLADLSASEWALGVLLGAVTVADIEATAAFAGLPEHHQPFAGQRDPQAALATPRRVYSGPISKAQQAGRKK